MNDDTITEAVATDAEKLLPCPFCGGKGRLYQRQNAASLWRVACENCDAGPSSDIGKDAAIKTWNTRPAPRPPDAGVREALQAAYDFLQDKSFIPDSETHRCTKVLEQMEIALTIPVTTAFSPEEVAKAQHAIMRNPFYRDHFGDNPVAAFGLANSALKAVASPNASAEHAKVVEALTLAEDELSRSPHSTQIWANGTHPQTGITKIREALAALSDAGMKP